MQSSAVHPANGQFAVKQRLLQFQAIHGLNIGVRFFFILHRDVGTGFYVRDTRPAFPVLRQYLILRRIHGNKPREYCRQIKHRLSGWKLIFHRNDSS